MGADMLTTSLIGHTCTMKNGIKTERFLIVGMYLNDEQLPIFIIMDDKGELFTHNHRVITVLPTITDLRWIQHGRQS